MVMILLASNMGVLLGIALSFSAIPCKDNFEVAIRALFAIIIIAFSIIVLIDGKVL